MSFTLGAAAIQKQRDGEADADRHQEEGHEAHIAKGWRRWRRGRPPYRRPRLLTASIHDTSEAWPWTSGDGGRKRQTVPLLRLRRVRRLSRFAAQGADPAQRRSEDPGGLQGARRRHPRDARRLHRAMRGDRTFPRRHDWFGAIGGERRGPASEAARSRGEIRREGRDARGSADALLHTMGSVARHMFRQRPADRRAGGRRRSRPKVCFDRACQGRASGPSGAAEGDQPVSRPAVHKRGQSRRADCEHGGHRRLKARIDIEVREQAFRLTTFALGLRTPRPSRAWNGSRCRTLSRTESRISSAFCAGTIVSSKPCTVATAICARFSTGPRAARRRRARA